MPVINIVRQTRRHAFDVLVKLFADPRKGGEALIDGFGEEVGLGPKFLGV